jgi:hypothetical protein
MKKAFVLSICVLALGACNQQGGASDADAAQAALERIMGRADCVDQPDLAPGEGGCRINPKGGEAASDRHILVDANANGDAVIATVVDNAGAPLQTLEESGVTRLMAPQQDDFDGDGALDLVFTRDTGNVNSVQALWRQNPTTGAYTRLGEVSGVVITRTKDGEIAVAARSSAASWEVGYSRIANDKLESVARVEVSAAGMENGAVTGVTCTLLEAPAGANKKAAQQKYCADPAAADVFK